MTASPWVRRYCEPARLVEPRATSPARAVSFGKPWQSLNPCPRAIPGLRFSLRAVTLQLSALAGRAGSGVPAAAGESALDAALRQLQSAVSGGYRNPDLYRTESALDPLRDHPDLGLLMLDLAFPTQPFARDD